MNEHKQHLNILPWGNGWKVIINGHETLFDTWEEVLQFLAEIGL